MKGSPSYKRDSLNININKNWCKLGHQSDVSSHFIIGKRVNTLYTHRRLFLWSLSTSNVSVEEKKIEYSSFGGVGSSRSSVGTGRTGGGGICGGRFPKFFFNHYSLPWKQLRPNWTRGSLRSLGGHARILRTTVQGIAVVHCSSPPRRFVRRVTSDKLFL